MSEPCDTILPPCRNLSLAGCGYGKPSPSHVTVTFSYGLLGLIAFRIIWGFIGTKHARFSDFVTKPMDTVAYIKEIVFGHPKRYIGHNPAGAAMMLLLLLAVTGAAGTGWAMTTEG